MGNGLSPCCSSRPNSSSIKLVFWEGTTKTMTGKRLAGEVMYDFPGSIVCHADSFYIGHRIPSLSIEDELINGETYLVLPAKRFPVQILSSASLAALASTPKRTPFSLGSCPFEYVKDTHGRVMIKVLPEFIMRIILSRDKEQRCDADTTGLLCSTPELQKHYTVLVGSKDRAWSPKLETIVECKTRLLSTRLLRRFQSSKL